MTRDDLRRALELLPSGASLTLPRDALLAALGDGEAHSPAVVEMPEVPDAYLTAEQIAERYNVSSRWAYDHGAELGARRLSRRCTRFPTKAVERFFARRRV